MVGTQPRHLSDFGVPKILIDRIDMEGRTTQDWMKERGRKKRKGF
jgi:hypothetical protein